VTELVKLHSASSSQLPDFVEPMKAKLLDSMPSGDWIYEIKFDGYRALALRCDTETRVLSRNKKDLGGKFPFFDFQRNWPHTIRRFIFKGR
jgi:bifunctional non-homologous end joining protein LigD